MRRKSVILLLLLVVMLIGCTQKKISFQNGSHEREEGYAAVFQTKYKESDNITLHIQSNIFTEELAGELDQIVSNDYNVIKKASGGIEQPITIYVVKETITGNPQVVDNKVFCSVAHIKAREYQSYLVQASLPIKNMWQSVGLENYLFQEKGEQINSVEELSNYYKNEENLTTLSLVPAYFMEKFVDENTSKIAYQTSYLLTEYILNTYGIEKFISTDNLKIYRQEWLESIDVTVSLEDLNCFTDNMCYELENKVPLTMIYENFTFYFEPVDWLSDADDIYDLLVSWKEGYDLMITKLETEEPEAFELIKERMNEPIYINLSDYSSKYTCAAYDNSIYLIRKRDIYHEIVHILLPVNKEIQWMYEGTAEYISRSIRSIFEGEEEKQGAYEVVINSGKYEVETEADKKLCDYVSQYYLERASKPKEVKEVDGNLVQEATGTFTLTYPEIKVTEPFATAKDVIWHDDDRTKGNWLTYPEAQVVVTYLADEYGFETVIKVLKGMITFEEAFGADVPTVIETCIEYLKNQE